MARTKPATVIDEIKVLRDAGWTDARIAERVGVDERTIRRWADPLDDSMPQAPSWSNLRRLVRATRPPLHFGICCEFLDCTLPVLVEITKAHTEFDLPPISFNPVNWDNRCLNGLQHGLLDYVIYNERVTRAYEADTGAKFGRAETSSNFLQSGSFYMALRGPQVKQPSRVQTESWLTRTLKAEDIIYLVPAADMRVALDEVLSKLSISSPFDPQSKQKSPPFSPPPGYGLSLFLERPPSIPPDSIMVFIGGQDQLAELLDEQPKHKDIAVVTADELGALAPHQDLSHNVLLARPNPSVGLDEIISLLNVARKRIRATPSLMEDAKIEAARWHWLASSRYIRDNNTEQQPPIGRIKKKFESIIARKLSPMAVDWLGPEDK